MCATRLKRLDVSVADEPEAAQAAVRKHQTVASVPASSSLTSPLHVLTSLVDLNLANNELGSQNGDGRHVLETFTKAGFPRLASLDVRNNFPAEGELQDELLRITTVRYRCHTSNPEMPCPGRRVISKTGTQCNPHRVAARGGAQSTVTTQSPPIT